MAPDAVFSQSATTASLRQGSRIKSSTFLQMLIYFNAYYSLAQAILSALILRWKSANGKDTAASSAVLALWAAFEIPRLYAGSVGNLKEKVRCPCSRCTTRLTRENALTCPFSSPQRTGMALAGTSPGRFLLPYCDTGVPARIPCRIPGAPDANRPRRVRSVPHI